MEKMAEDSLLTFHVVAPPISPRVVTKQHSFICFPFQRFPGKETENVTLCCDKEMVSWFVSVYDCNKDPS